MKCSHQTPDRSFCLSECWQIFEQNLMFYWISCVCRLCICWIWCIVFKYMKHENACGWLFSRAVILKDKAVSHPHANHPTIFMFDLIRGNQLFSDYWFALRWEILSARPFQLCLIAQLKAKKWFRWLFKGWGINPSTKVELSCRPSKKDTFCEILNLFPRRLLSLLIKQFKLFRTIPLCKESDRHLLELRPTGSTSVPVKLNCIIVFYIATNWDELNKGEETKILFPSYFQPFDWSPSFRPQQQQSEM